MIAFFGLHLHLHEHIHHLVERGGYPVLFALLACCGLGLPLPEDVPLITAGIMIQKGQFNLAIAAICAWCGIIGGDCMLYGISRKFGKDVTRIPIIGRHVNVKRMAKVEMWFEHWGIWVVAVGRMFAGLRGAMVVVAGATRYNFWKFIIADGLAAVVSGGLFILLGYKFAEHLDYLKALVGNIRNGMLLGLIALIVGILAYVLWRKYRTQEAPSADAATPDEPTARGGARPQVDPK